MTIRPIRAAALALLLTPAALLAQDAPTAQTAIATVNGQPIELGDLIAMRQQLPEQYQSLPDEALYDGLRRQLIDQSIISEAAIAAGADKMPGAARALEMQRRTLLSNFFMRDAIDQRLTDERVEAAYKARYVEVEPTREIRASHILVKTREEADALKAQLDGGAEFAELAKEHGTDGTKAAGGDLGWFEQGAMVPAFADAAFAIEKEGDVAGPVETQFGWHMIKLTGKRDQPVPALNEVRDGLEAELGDEIAAEIVEELRAAAEVESPEDRPGLPALRDDALLTQ